MKLKVHTLCLIEETPCTKECGEEGKPKDQITDSDKLIKPEWIDKCTDKMVKTGNIYDCSVGFCPPEHKKTGCPMKNPPCQHQWFEIKIEAKKTGRTDMQDEEIFKYGVCVGCILCPEVRKKWEDGKIEILNQEKPMKPKVYMQIICSCLICNKNGKNVVQKINLPVNFEKEVTLKKCKEDCCNYPEIREFYKQIL